MTDGFAAMDQQLTRLRALPGLVDRAAPDIARGVEGELRSSIARAQSPAGVAWKPTRDGRAPLRNAGIALDVKNAGSTIVATLTGIEARHHRGWVRGGVARPILPTTGELPPALGRAVKEALSREFTRTMTGAR